MQMGDLRVKLLPSPLRQFVQTLPVAGLAPFHFLQVTRKQAGFGFGQCPALPERAGSRPGTESDRLTSPLKARRI